VAYSWRITGDAPVPGGLASVLNKLYGVASATAGKISLDPAKLVPGSRYTLTCAVKIMGMARHTLPATSFNSFLPFD